MIFFYTILILYTLSLHSMEDNTPSFSLKRLSTIMGYHKAKKLGDTISLPISSATMHLLHGLQEIVPDVNNHYATLYSDDLLKKAYVHSYAFYKQLSKHRHAITAIAFDPQTNNLYAGSETGSIKIWNMQSPERLYKMKGHSSAITAIAIHPSKPIIATGTCDSLVKVWHLDTKESFRVTKRKRFNYTPIRSMVIHPDTNNLFFSSGADVFKTTTNEKTNIERIISFSAYEDTIRTISIHPSTKELAITNQDSIRLHNLDSNKTTDKKKLHCWWHSHMWYIVTSLTIDPITGYYFYSLDYNEEICMQNPHTSNIFQCPVQHTMGINALALENAGTLYSASKDKTIGICKPIIHFPEARKQYGFLEWLVLMNTP